MLKVLTIKSIHKYEQNFNPDLISTKFYYFKTEFKLIRFNYKDI